MDITPAAMWLNTVFRGFDLAVLEFMHRIAESAGFILTPVMKFISMFGKSGIFFIILGILLLVSKKTRKTGVCLLVAIFIGFVITNVTVKQIVARPRPYDTYEFVRRWWEFAGHSIETDMSFPSGHTTVTAASMTAVYLTLSEKSENRMKIFIPAVLAVILMCFSRMYLMMHYPTDVIGGLISGITGGLISYFIVRRKFY